MNRKFILRFCLTLTALVINGAAAPAQTESSNVKITFKNVVKDTPVVLYEASYINPFGENYTINKFRYYISNMHLGSKNRPTDTDSSVYLIDEAREESKSITISVPSGHYSFLEFQLGVDSIYNVSGAQTGALDPVKDMFWTWHTGYVMAKLEGNSPSSDIVNQKYEYHIGGFAGANNVLKKIKLPFTGNESRFLAPGKVMEIIIRADVDAWFQHPHDLKIADRAAINSPGKFAVAMSENYADMFTIDQIIYHP